MKLPVKLEKKRDELADKFNEEEWGSCPDTVHKVNYKIGYNACAEELLPLVEEIKALCEDHMEASKHQEDGFYKGVYCSYLNVRCLIKEKLGEL